MIPDNALASEEAEKIGVSEMFSPKRYLAGIWLVSPVIGCAAGAIAAVGLYPELGFAENPTGEYHPEMLLFAGLVGLGLALGQALAFIVTQALAWWRVLLWVPLTTVAVMGMIMPLWWVNAEVLLLVPWYAAFQLGPGLLALGVLQAFLLHPRIEWWRWLGWTLLGGAIGAVAGLFVGGMLSYILPFEAGWAGSVAAGMALLQRMMLVRLDKDEEEDVFK